MKRFSFLLLAITSFFVIKPVYSQVDLKLIIRNPTPSEVYEWQQDPTIIQLIVNNQTTNEYPNATFGFRISDENGKIIAESKFNNRSVPRFNIAPMPQVTIINGTQLIDVNSISYYIDLKSLVLSANCLPEGYYEICISLYDQMENNITSGEEYCTSFTILIPEPPVIITPTDDEILTTPFPNFIWSPVTNFSTTRNQIQYKLKICPVYKGQSARTAIETNPVLLEKTDLISTSYMYLPSDMPFDYFTNVERYVWMVQAFDLNGKPATSNQGKSELGTFLIKQETITDISLANIYPVNNDTIPWVLPHLVTQFSPYSDDVTSVELTLHVVKEGTKDELTNSRLLTFNGGSKLSQQLNTDEEASIIVSNLDNNMQFPDWMQHLEKGVKYNWFVEAVFTKSDGSSQAISTTETSFVIGFKKPTKIYPSKDTSIKANAKFDFTFQLSAPESLNFENNLLLKSTTFHAFNSYSDALSKFSVEIARKTSFDSIVQTQIIEIPSGSKYQTGNECSDLYTKISKQMTALKDTGKYYYRINYLDISDQKFYSSPARLFKIVPDSIISCFEMLVESPVNNGTWTASKKPKFSVSIKPEIKKSAITGGRIKVWKKTSSTQSNEEAKTKKAVLDTTFTGNEDKKIFAYSTDMSGFTRFDLNFINGDSSSIAFTADTSSNYLWNFTLNFNKDSIRKDKQVCNNNSVISNDGTFKVKPTSELADTGSCPGNCYADEPSNKTPGTQSLKKDSTITIGKFKIKLNTVSGTPGFLSGDGSVDVPYLRGNILVEFNGLKVNSDNVVYEGEAFAKIDQAAPYTKAEGNDFEGKALSFAEDKMKFKAIHEFSSSSGKIASALISTTPVSLPIGFDKDIDGYKVVIGIIGMRFTPVKGTLNAAMYVELPSLGPEVGLGLGAKDICFHKDGLEASGNGKLYLAQDLGYDNDETWSFLFKAPTPTDEGTYASWNCKGFKELVIAADVEFPRSWLLPAPDPDPSKKVKAHFKTRADKYGNGWEWLADASLDKCELAGAKGYKMQVQEMAFDYSSARNPAGVLFPKSYTGTKTNEWKGFYIKSAKLTFPEKFKTFDDEYPELSVNQVIIDKTGFTASIIGNNIIQYPKADFGDWGASIDTLKINLVNSSLQSGSMRGKLKVSIFDSSLVYKGLISNLSNDKLKYQFSIVPKDSINTELGKAKLYLYPTSKIELLDTTNGFLASADLTGKFTMEGSLGVLSKLNFKGISFEKFKVQSKSPYFDKGNWSFASPQHSMEGFPVSINNFDIVTGSRSGGFGAGLQFDLNIGLQEGSNAISGTTKLSVWSKLNMGSNGQNFEFDGVELDSIGVNADMGSVRIKGGLALYNANSTFGNGFRGIVNATFVDKVSVEATAQFGNVNNYQYWYVDAKAIFPTAVPIVSGIGMYGFGGGAWYHMRKNGTPDLSTSATEPDGSNNPAATNSGYSYIPDKNVNFGLNASLVIGTHPSAEAFNGDVGLEAQFLSGGGLGTVSLVGEGYMMCGITNRNKAKVLANLDLEYSVPTETFHGVFDVDINAYPLDGGGQMVMHVDPSLWYMKIGEPTNPITLSLAGWLQAQSYLMIGQGLPSPTVPNEIQELYGSRIMDRKPAISNGNGFVFGANTGFDTGRKEYLGFYGDFSALAGFDMSLLNYTEGVRCEGSDDPMGINGWYAYGQIYSYISATIGLHVDLWFTEGNYEILDMQAGSILQGAGPNPTWLKGTVGGEYRILGGRVKGNCNFHFSMGDQCEMIQENPLSRIDLITDVSPTSGSEDVEVMVEPQVATNFELNEPFDLREMPEGNGAPTIRTFQVKLKEFNLRKSYNNDSVPGKINIDPDGFSAYYSTHDILSGHTNYNLDVSAYGEELIDGVWHPAVKTDGSLITQTESTNFKTGSAPDKIENQFVAYTYPVRNQNFFLQDECRSGRIQLKTGMHYLFAVGPYHNMELIARFVPTGEDVQTKEVPFTYNSTTNSLNFDIPDLNNNTEYYIQFVKKLTPKESERLKPTDTDNDESVSKTSVNELSTRNSDAGNVIISGRKLLTNRIREDEKILYALRFKTSQYNSLQAKLNAYNYITTNSEFYPNNQEIHKAVFEGVESFGYHDLKTVQWTKSGAIHTFGPLIKVNGYDRTAVWHSNFVNPKVYDKIQWLISKNWWSSSQMTEFNHYYYSSNHDLVELKANGYYEPPASEFSQMVTQNNIVTSASAGTSTSSAAIGSSYSMGVLTTTSASTTTGTSSGSSYAGSMFAGSSSGGVSGTNFSPGNAGGINLSDLQALEDFTPNLILTYNHGKVIPVDFNRLRERAVHVLSYYYLLLSNSDKYKLNSILNTNYQPMLHGNYPLKFYYNYRGCLGVDEDTPTINKPFVY